jgi:hypothetical protein
MLNGGPGSVDDRAEGIGIRARVHVELLHALDDVTHGCGFFRSERVKLIKWLLCEELAIVGEVKVESERRERKEGRKEGRKSWQKKKGMRMRMQVDGDG